MIALGSRLGPFGTLPQHGMDYWPKDAKIIQIDADHKMLGLVKKITVGICGDAKAAAKRARRSASTASTLACDATEDERAADRSRPRRPRGRRNSTSGPTSATRTAST